MPINIGSKLAHNCLKLKSFSLKKNPVIRNPNITYNIIISVYIKAKNPLLIDLALAIILSLYAGLDLIWVALLTLLKIIYIPIQI